MMKSVISANNVFGTDEMVIVFESEAFPNERGYALSVIFTEFLGIDFQVMPGAAVNQSPVWEIRQPGSEKRLVLPDIFFSNSKAQWLAPGSLAQSPLKSWRLADVLPEANTLGPDIPILYGDDPEGPGFFKASPNEIYLGLDIFGSVFFMLSRYEEMVKPDRDEHDRFPATASLAFAENFLDRPVVDEYVEILWACMKRLWPGLERKQRVGRVVPTCDLDSPYDPSAASLWRMTKRLGGDVIRRRSVRQAIERIQNAMAVRRLNFDSDAYYTFDRYMDVCEEKGRHASFFFIADNSGHEVQAKYDINRPWFANLACRMLQRGHEIGMHGGYDTFQDAEQIRLERARLMAACRKAGINAAVSGNRQHYLRWDSGVTPAMLGSAGFKYDTSGSFADQPGFRFGTARPFPMWDWRENRKLDLEERPLILMECSVISDRYMGLGYSREGFDIMLRLKERALQFGGDFTFLWHNGHFLNPEDWVFFEGIL